MNDVRPHDLQQRPGLPEGRRRATNHEGQGSGLGTADAARHRRVEHLEPGIRRRGADLAGSGHVNGRAIDQQRIRVGAGDDPAVTQVYGFYMLAGGHHGNYHFNAAGRLGNAAGGFRTRFNRRGHRRLNQVEDLQRMPSGQQVFRHRQAHVAQPDKSDLRHFSFPYPQLMFSS